MMFLHIPGRKILDARLIRVSLLATVISVFSLIGSVPIDMADKMSMIKFIQRSWITLNGMWPRVAPLIKTIVSIEKLIVSWNWRNFRTLSNIARPQRIDRRIDEKLLSRMMRSAWSLATSQPLPIHKPTSAYLSTSESAIPSPAMATSPPCYYMPRIRTNLSSGVAREIILTLRFTALNYSGLSKLIFVIPVSLSTYFS